jgi:hypothetical protein
MVLHRIILYMKQALILCSFFCIGMFAYAQQPAKTDTAYINKDSLEKELDAFLSMLDSANKPKSYFQVGLGFSNTQFSNSNIALNAQQISSGVTLVPTIGYFHKSGFGISYNNFLVLNSSGSGIAQHSITPSFDYDKGKAFGFGIYYTRFIRNQNFNSSPYKNDLFSYIEYKKPKLQPSISFGYSTGGYNEYTQTDTFAVIQRPFRPDTLIRFKKFDTLQVGIRDFSMIASVKTEFDWKGFSAKDYFTFTPSFLLFFASNNYDISYSSGSQFSRSLQQISRNNPLLFRQLQNQLQQQFPEINNTRNFLNNSGFNLQSLGLSLDATWYIGKFYLNPQLYFDYYLLSSENKLTSLFSVQAGFMF